MSELVSSQIVDTSASVESALVELRSRFATTHSRIDQTMLDNAEFIEDHALHDSLAGNRKIAVYEVYKMNDGFDIVCLIKFGQSVTGHPGIVHGGITALLFDNTFGWAMYVRDPAVGVTANLNINYRCVHYYPVVLQLNSMFGMFDIRLCVCRRYPVFANSYAVLRVRVDRVEGRKSFLSGSLEGTDGQLLAEGTSLFIGRKKE